MELLILGIDAGDERIISAMDLPHLNKILKENHSYKAEEDLSSRGWAEMLSGLNGQDTGAFYAKPKLDGTRACTLSFDTRDYEENKLVVPLWNLINSKGKSIGFMNIPTTKYAPEINGFFVSGAGGGLSGVEGIPEEFCCPPEIAKDLDQMNYIIDTRLMSSGVKDMGQWLALLKETMKKRTEGYLKLYKKIPVDIGFLVYIGICRMQYLAMSEIEEIIANEGKASNKLQEEIIDLYRFFDNEIGKLLQEISPENVMVVSDHGQSKYLYDINVDYFLKRFGFWDNKLTDKAFGMFYVSGIFINDDRFEGTVKEEEKEDLIREIIEKFNNSGEARIYGMNARRYRAMHMDKKFHELLPDIWIDAPETMFFLPWSNRFIRMNCMYGPVENLKNVTNEMNTGIKGKKALMSAPFSFKDIPEDLTGVYEIVRHYLEH